MLPPGHIAAGYLVAKIFIHATLPNLPPDQIQDLLLTGCLFGFAPDLDMFYIFWKEKAFRQTGEKFNHRQLILHVPLVWLIFGIAVAILGHSLYWFYVGAIIWLASWSHFLLDSFNMGVRWLHPFNAKFYALKNPGVTTVNHAPGFFPHWWNLVKQYYVEAKPVFYLEIIIICVALIKFFSK
ncbi:MAG: metal-dependent hydrolase [bacterium]|nr:metal-dependent hydrolase [bacterium]